jgi:alkanesulfonate monooxygenase SsuD/methylene tetrahydromethanopterin reductase-like flavin-dependent oxidoreductase (luciferase family)
VCGLGCFPTRIHRKRCGSLNRLREREEHHADWSVGLSDDGIHSSHASRLGPEAEARGFDSIFTVEQPHIPASRKTPYPIGGDLPSIYHPITLAKRVASLDALSGGRFLFGVGAGWNAEELENHDFASRSDGRFSTNPSRR